MNLIIEQDAVDQLKPQVNKLLEMLGYDHRSCLVTDLSTFLDFLCQFKYPTLEDANEALRSVLIAQQIHVEIKAWETIANAAVRILTAHPNWPDTVQPTLH